MVQHDYNRRIEDKAEPRGKGFVYLLIGIAVSNALFIIPAVYILN